MLFEHLPPTVNFHLVGHCNYKCRGCYARFEDAKTFLPVPAATPLLDLMKARAVTRVTFAGGEPTLHPQLLAVVKHASRIGLVTSLVTNASQIDERWCVHHLPWLRWLVLSCDSVDRETSHDLGRTARHDQEGQPARVLRTSRMVHRWNLGRAPMDQVRLKINMVVSRLTQHEDPSAWLEECAPERVKLMQCLIVPGENTDARDLACSDDAFRVYVDRVRNAQGRRRIVVAESATDLQRSYAMIDPRGSFRQAHPAGYVTSQPILDVGVEAAWEQVGGFDAVRFHSRGGVYEHGTPATGVRAKVIAIEGLDGSGKTAVVRALAERLGAVVIRCPPASMVSERARADALPAQERRRFYQRANVEALRLAHEQVLTGNTVVMDQSFASTLAYGAAERDAIASQNDAPSELFRPDHLFFLSLPEAERTKRLAGRAVPLTDEERRLGSDAAFRERVIAGYRNVGCTFVDAGASLDDTVQAVIGVVGGDPAGAARTRSTVMSPTEYGTIREV